MRSELAIIECGSRCRRWEAEFGIIERGRGRGRAEQARQGRTITRWQHGERREQNWSWAPNGRWRGSVNYSSVLDCAGCGGRLILRGDVSTQYKQYKNTNGIDHVFLHSRLHAKNIIASVSSLLNKE